MVTCYLKYIIDPFKQKEFEHYVKLWIDLIPEFGGTHHGAFLPHEGASDVALVLFSFPSLAEYEQYRSRSKTHAGCRAAMEYYREARCFLSFERSFFKPIFP